ncbi:MAG: hypothetical protein M0P32_08595 [Bacteroidales bacterium]|nr:hypothetical protein [Bacteroidales bacterium]
MSLIILSGVNIPPPSVIADLNVKVSLSSISFSSNSELSGKISENKKQ